METVAPQYITDRAALLAWVEHLAKADVIAVDTESDSLHHYREKVCLVQMTALGLDALIDPLALPDLSPLAPVFADPKRRKIFHDAGYDLVSLGRDFGFRVQGIFDTMLASRLLGLKEFGLATILKARFDFVADKRLQRSDWARRPLTPAQLSYARYDTHFLPELARQLEQELRERNRLAWAEEEFARLPEVALRASPRPTGGDPEGFWRIRGVRSLSPVEKGRLRTLYAMRDIIAARLDRPKFKVLGDPVLIELAQNPPASLDALPRPGLRRAGVDRFGQEILRALAEAKPVHGGPPPGSGRRKRAGRFLDAEVRERFDALRTLRREKADALGVDPEVALGNAALEDLARHPPATVEDVRSRADMRGWRRAVFADAIFTSLQTVASQPRSESEGEGSHGRGRGREVKGGRGGDSRSMPLSEPDVLVSGVSAEAESAHRR
jgi:ribonuclease D